MGTERGNEWATDAGLGHTPHVLCSDLVPLLLYVYGTVGVTAATSLQQLPKDSPGLPS